MECDFEGRAGYTRHIVLQRAKAAAHSSAGNICRSPTAEAVFKKVVDRADVADEFVIDSCGTGGGNEDW